VSGVKPWPDVRMVAGGGPGYSCATEGCIYSSRYPRLNTYLNAVYMFQWWCLTEGVVTIHFSLLPYVGTNSLRKT
jgi:hypothetical protein